MSLERHRLRVDFARAGTFRREYLSNIANGGIFIESDAPIAVRDVVVVEIGLAYRDQTIELEGEVVHRIPPEMSATGAVPGVAVQFELSAKQLRAKFEPLVGTADGDERASQSGRRVARRSQARVQAKVESSSQGEVAGRSRDISRSGMLISVAGKPIPVGEPIVVTVAHPQTGEALQVDGKVVRHVRSDVGEVTAMGIEFCAPEARQAEVSSFVSDVQVTEHSRRLGGITGPIAELGIENLLQMFGSSSHQGTLTLTRGAEEGFIAFEGGMLCGARVGRASGTAALRQMLGWREGSFEFEARVEESELRDSEIPLSGAILDALCEIDERSRSREAGQPPVADGSESAAGTGSSNVPAHISPDGTFTADTARADSSRGELTKTEEAVLDLACVGMSVDKMLEVIPERQIEVYTALDSLLERGLIRCR